MWQNHISMQHYPKTKSGLGQLKVRYSLPNFFQIPNFILPLWSLSSDYAGLPVYFIEPLHPDNFFRRGQYYGEDDDFRRFSYFSRAALDLLLQTGKKPDIIHCHDWQTAFVVCSLLRASSISLSFDNSHQFLTANHQP